MSSKREKLLLFFLYFLITTGIPVVVLASEALRLFASGDNALLVSFGVLVVLLVVGQYEWRQIPENPLSILGWFFSPVIIFIASFAFFDFSSILENIKINGGAIALSVVVSFCLIQIGDLLSQQKIVKKNIETYKTPFLQSYWKKKWWSLPDDIAAAIAGLLFFISLGTIVFVVTVIKYIPPPQSFYLFGVFVISVMSNSIVFYRTERPKMI